MSQLWQLNASEITRLIKAGEVSATDVTEQALDRLQSVNPGINAVVQQMPEEALAAARRVDEQIKAGKDAGILCGVPVTVKVNVDQVGHATTNGVRIQNNVIADRDSPVVENFRKAGAIIIGRTNTPAFSMRWFTRNSLHGHTLNPRNPTLTPGGSSGGAASGVAAGIGAIGHGTDIAGSIRYPAYACGLQGLRPSLGRVPAVNLSLPDRYIGAQITAVSGPIARSVEDLRLALHALSASSALDPWWVPASIENSDFEKRATLCISPDGLEIRPEIESALLQAAEQLRDAGWQVNETDIPPMRQAMHYQLNMWISEYALKGGEAVSREDDPDANFVYAQLAEQCDAPTFETLMHTLQERVRLAREWQEFLSEHSVLLCPISAEPPFPDLLDVESPGSFRRVLEAQMTQIALPFMGMPAMSVATGIDNDIPKGVQLVAARFREDILFRAAADIEQRSPPIEIAEPGRTVSPALNDR